MRLVVGQRGEERRDCVADVAPQLSVRFGVEQREERRRQSRRRVHGAAP